MGTSFEIAKKILAITDTVPGAALAEEDEGIHAVLQSITFAELVNSVHELGTGQLPAATAEQPVTRRQK